MAFGCENPVFFFFFFLFFLYLIGRSSDVPLGGTFQQTSGGAEKSHLGLTARNGFRKQGLMVFPGDEGTSLLMRRLNSLVKKLPVSTEDTEC